MYIDRISYAGKVDMMMRSQAEVYGILHVLTTNTVPKYAFGELLILIPCKIKIKFKSVYKLLPANFPKLKSNWPSVGAHA